MVSIEQIKAILNDPYLSEEEVQRIRDDLYALAALIFEIRRKKNN